MNTAQASKLPWLLYAYPWMPSPRRLIVYLREKGVPESHVKIVKVLDPKDGNSNAEEGFPPCPASSLPTLAIPNASRSPDNRVEEWTYIRQSLAIIRFLDEVYASRAHDFTSSRGSLLGNDILEKARIEQLLSLADECTSAWNPVRLFGIATSDIAIPDASKESLRWVRRMLGGIERYWKDRDMSVLRKGQNGHVTAADIVMYQFLEFTQDCYGVDMTVGPGEVVKSVYGDDVAEAFPKLAEFHETFGSRDSAVRLEKRGEVPPEYAVKAMQAWNW